MVDKRTMGKIIIYPWNSGKILHSSLESKPGKPPRQ
uniref:Uncharacterized protein n=1 Tax=Siphoviridae sp. ctmpG14 TaxID=2825654 RepID=A0A8S5PB56_9CAUD|nr:MAG TPA: hypothetical protein [Siphoviridae sp. ctmpG14]